MILYYFTFHYSVILFYFLNLNCFIVFRFEVFRDLGCLGFEVQSFGVLRIQVFRFWFMGFSSFWVFGLSVWFSLLVFVFWGF